MTRRVESWELDTRGLEGFGIVFFFFFKVSQFQVWQVLCELEQFPIFAGRFWRFRFWLIVILWDGAQIIPTFLLQTCRIYERWNSPSDILVLFKSFYVVVIFPFFGEDSNIFIPFILCPSKSIIPCLVQPLWVSSWATYSPLSISGILNHNRTSTVFGSMNPIFQNSRYFLGSQVFSIDFRKL